MRIPDNGQFTWEGNTSLVRGLFSRAGVAHQIMITHNDDSVLFDCGDGTLRDYLEHRLKTIQLAGVCVTHGHYDHVGGLYTLLGFLRMLGRDKPLVIAGHADCRELWAVVDTFESCYRDTTPYTIIRQIVNPRQPFDIASITIEAYAVTHAGSRADGTILPPIPAYGYRVAAGQDDIAISGDSGMCDELRLLVQDADLAVIEATFGEEYDIDQRYLDSVHLSVDLAHQLGRTANDYVLVHRGKQEPRT
ncbi:MBL fold metallo-hydrolase [candidate division GN15 bacterium]|nr:MBL fold metallo-hydrolase [candidate division GN15 bacterium]